MMSFSISNRTMMCNPYVASSASIRILDGSTTLTAETKSAVLMPVSACRDLSQPGQHEREELGTAPDHVLHVTALRFVDTIAAWRPDGLVHPFLRYALLVERVAALVHDAVDAGRESLRVIMGGDPDVRVITSGERVLGLVKTAASVLPTVRSL